MNSENFYISVILPTHNHPWEIDKTLFSLEKQTGISHDNYEIIIVNTSLEDSETISVASRYNSKFKNIRLVQVYDIKASQILNATFPGNLGVKKFAKGNLILFVVDSARVPTPGVLRKMRDEFERWGSNIVTTTIPYHFYKHSSVPGFTIEECREKFLKTRWDKDVYHLFDYAAHTNISSSGRFNESTYLGISKENFMKVRGLNEEFKIWSEYNLDFFRRLTRNPPKDGIQIPGLVNDHWGKIGLGLEIHVLNGEADFHLHHSLSDASRNFNLLKEETKRIWKKYEELGECIIANFDNPDWGEGDCEEIQL